jgi:molybdate transport system ATP-binding protein
VKLQLRKIRLPLAEFDLVLDLEFEQQVTGVFGASGAGKTALLDLIAGLRRPDSAFIQLGETVLADTAGGCFVPPRERGVGYVPQDGALFPHFSVRGNLLYGAKRDTNPSLTLEHVADVLEIAPLLDRRIRDLSGGEKQRVACGRALLAQPLLLLLDEPLSALDHSLREKTLLLLHKVREEFGVQMIYVSHVPEEMMALCDEVVVLERGCCLRQGRAAEIFTATQVTAYRLRDASKSMQPS